MKISQFAMYQVIMDRDIKTLFCHSEDIPFVNVVRGIPILDIDWATQDSQRQIGHYNVLEKVAVKYFFSVLSVNPKTRKGSADDSTMHHWADVG